MANAEKVLPPEKAEKTAEVKCDNHPDRAGKTYTGGGAFVVHLCEECTPKWFKNSDTAL